MFINVIPQLEQCRSTSSVRMTFRRYRERIALWDHRTTLWARLRPALTKTADEWTRNLEKFENFERFKFNCFRTFKTERNTRRILGIITRPFLNRIMRSKF